jgi:hypothetical protein
LLSRIQQPAGGASAFGRALLSGSRKQAGIRFFEVSRVLPSGSRLGLAVCKLAVGRALLSESRQLAGPYAPEAARMSLSCMRKISSMPESGYLSEGTHLSVYEEDHFSSLSTGAMTIPRTQIPARRRWPSGHQPRPAQAQSLPGGIFSPLLFPGHRGSAHAVPSLPVWRCGMF